MTGLAAGTSGAIGQPLTAELARKRHSVRAMTHSLAGAKRLRECMALRWRKSDPISLDTVSTTMTGAKEVENGREKAEGDSWE